MIYLSSRRPSLLFIFKEGMHAFSLWAAALYLLHPSPSSSPRQHCLPMAILAQLDPTGRHKQEHAGGCSYLARSGTGASPAPVALCSINVNDHGLTSPASPAPPGTTAMTPHTTWSGRATSTAQMTRASSP
jgi:hypothetical protein